MLSQFAHVWIFIIALLFVIHSIVFMVLSSRLFASLVCVTAGVAANALALYVLLAACFLAPHCAISKGERLIA